MAAVDLTPFDLSAFAEIPSAKAQAMIDDALALAARVAPCILTAEFTEAAAARAILRGAVLRWHEAGSGVLQSQQAGIYGQTLDTRQQRRGMFWPSEIQALQELCQGADTSGAFAVDTVGFAGNMGHADSCALNFGGSYCSCGAVLTAGLYPLYGV